VRVKFPGKAQFPAFLADGRIALCRLLIVCRSVSGDERMPTSLNDTARAHQLQGHSPMTPYASPMGLDTDHSPTMPPRRPTRTDDDDLGATLFSSAGGRGRASMGYGTAAGSDAGGTRDSMMGCRDEGLGDHRSDASSGPSSGGDTRANNRSRYESHRDRDEGDERETQLPLGSSRSATNLAGQPLIGYVGPSKDAGGAYRQVSTGSGTCAKIGEWLHWRDLFALCNFSQVALSLAFVIYLAHEAWAHGGDLAYVLISYSVVLCVGIVIALVWLAALLFALDRTFLWCRVATAAQGSLSCVVAVLVSALLGTNAAHSEEPDEHDEKLRRYVLSRVVPVLVLNAVFQGLAFWKTDGLVAADAEGLDGEEGIDSEGAGSFAAVPDD
jgi:hypothetical protein